MKASRILAVALLLGAQAAAAATHRLDDSGSQVRPPAADWQWVPFTARSGHSELQMHVRVNVRIDTRAWAGRQGRIFMVLPHDGGSVVTATWETDGRLLGGRLASGERTLVFSGPLPGALLEDRMRVHLTTDSRLAAITGRRLAFHFELELP